MLVTESLRKTHALLRELRSAWHHKRFTLISSTRAQPVRNLEGICTTASGGFIFSSRKENKCMKTQFSVIKIYFIVFYYAATQHGRYSRPRFGV
jgi:hypothetical protein